MGNEQPEELAIKKKKHVSAKTARLLSAIERLSKPRPDLSYM